MKADSNVESKDPNKLKFMLKLKGIERFENGLKCLTLLNGYLRFFCAENVDPSEQYQLKFIYLFVLAFLFIGARYPIKTTAMLNTKLFIYEKIFFVLFCKLTVDKSSKLTEYQQHVHLPSFIAAQSAIYSCYTLHFNLHLINLISTWLMYAILLIVYFGLEQTWISMIQIVFTLYAQIFSRRTSMALEENLEQNYKLLQRSQQLLQSVFNYLPEGVLICNFGKLQFWNTSFESIIQSNDLLLGEQCVTVENMKGIEVKIQLSSQIDSNQDISMFESDNPREKSSRMSFLWDIIQEMAEYETCQLKLVQQKQHLQLFKIHLKETEETLIFFRDITAIRGQQKQKLHQQMQSVFLSSISHDLKSPINQILSACQYFQVKHKDSEEFRIYKLQEGSCNFMLSLIDDITDLSKLQLNKFELNPFLFNLRELVDELHGLFEIKLQEKGLLFIKQFSEEVPEVVCLDRKRMKQILMNLISNAVKFTLHGSISLKVRVVHRPDIEEQAENQGLQIEEEEKVEGDFGGRKSYLEIEVTDTGVGISPEGQKKLFKLFGMLNKTKAINPNGTGLGLVICKRLSEEMGGSMEVKSKENEGSTFKASILIQNQFIFDDEDHKFQSSRSCTFSSIPKIDDALLMPQFANYKFLQRIQFDHHLCNRCSKYLVIDDDSFNILALELLIDTFHERKVDSALSALQGIEKLNEKLKKCCCRPYEFIFVDLNMPHMNGVEMMEQVTRMIQANERDMGRYSESQFILCTAQSQHSIEEIISKGFNHYLEKPVRRDELQKIISKQGWN